MAARDPNEIRMQMLYGVNQADRCADFAIGPARGQIQARLREVDTRMVRLFVFDKGAPDPVTEWPKFASYIQAVLDIGAVPMLTFAKLQRPLDDPRAIRWFTNQCGDVVWNCIEPFWWDWAWRFVNEIDNSLIGFLDWHRYADWRNYGENGAPSDPVAYEGLLMSQAPDYGDRARAIGRLLDGRDILNICGELNTHSHYTEPVRVHFNQGVFGAAFYTTAVLHLMRAGVFAEMFWTGNEDRGGYGMLNKHGEPWPVFYAKKLCTQHIRRGDTVSFPALGPVSREVDVVVARGDDGQCSVLVVHLKGDSATYALSELTDGLNDYRTLLKIDASTGNRIMETSFEGRISFEGYGVAVVTVPASHEKFHGEADGGA